MKTSMCPLTAVLRAIVLAGSLFALLVVCPSPGLTWDSPGLSGGAYLGNLSANPYSPHSIANPFGAGNPYEANGLLNPYGPYGNPSSLKSWSNPYATEAPRLFNGQGEYRGTLSVNPYAPDSISNPYGTFGNPYSPASIHNPFGAGNPYRADSPSNPYGSGWSVFGR